MTQCTAPTTATLPQWPDRAIVQRVLAQLPWCQNIALIERSNDLRADWQVEANLKELGYGG